MITRGDVDRYECDWFGASGPERVIDSIPCIDSVAPPAGFVMIELTCGAELAACCIPHAKELMDAHAEHPPQERGFHPCGPRKE